MIQLSFWSQRLIVQNSTLRSKFSQQRARRLERLFKRWLNCRVALDFIKVQVHLPALANIPSYVPPPVTEVMSISFSSGKPIYGVKTSSGVSAACLPAYFEASGQEREIWLKWSDHNGISDSYRQRLENEIGYFAGKTDTGKGQISQVTYHLSLLLFFTMYVTDSGQVRQTW